MSVQKQKDFYHARFSYSLARGRTCRQAEEHYLQCCNKRDNPSPPLSEPAPPVPLKFYLLSQVYALFMQAGEQMNITGQEFHECDDPTRDRGYSFPYYTFNVHPRFIVSVHCQIQNRAVWLTAHYLSEQFDEYYSFASAYPSLAPAPAPAFNFFNTGDALTLVVERILIKSRRESAWKLQDYSTVLIPQ